jgi:hypothetical protein
VLSAKSLIFMVGATGIEPVTLAMSRQGLQRNPLIFLNMAATLIGVCATIVPLTFSLSGSMNQRALLQSGVSALCSMLGVRDRWSQ